MLKIEAILTLLFDDIEKRWRISENRLYIKFQSLQKMNSLVPYIFVCLFLLNIVSYVLNTKNVREDTYNFNFPFKKYFLSSKNN